MQWIDPAEHLSYQMPVKIPQVKEEDFLKTAIDYVLAKSDIDAASFQTAALNAALYKSRISKHHGHTVVLIGEDTLKE